ncbi:MAG: NAD-binding protein [Rhodocyclaceae bacterium]|nr:NAD-binding protein [Rhodocyclaceae bacterium]
MQLWWRRHGGLVLACFFGLGLVGAFWGFLELGKSGLNAAHLTLQLIVLNVDLSADQINWQLQIARFLLPGIAAYATITSFLVLAGHHAHFLKLKWRPPQSIFLGAGRIAVGLSDRINNTRPVVALDLDIDQTHARTLAAQGVLLIKGNATDSGILQKLNVARAEVIYVLTGNDQCNLDIAREIIELTNERDQKPHLVLSITSRVILGIACQDPEIVAYRARGGVITWFNAPAQAARVLLGKYPPDREIIPETSKPPLHIAIAGFGKHGQAIALQVVRTCVYADERPVQVSVFAEDRQAYESFLLRYPALNINRVDPAHGGFAPLAKMHFIPHASSSTDPATVRKAQAAAPFAIVYVAMDDDYSSITAALRFAQIVRALGSTSKVICVLAGTRFGTEAEALTLFEASKDTFRGVQLFHAISSSVRQGEKYPGADSDSLGIAVNAAYDSADSTDSVQMFESWKKLSEDFRWSSRHCADHIPVKLRAIGFDLIDSDGKLNDAALQEAIDRNLEMLECMEHRRYCIERLLDGWLYAESTDKEAEGQNKKQKLNRTIVPFDFLPEHEPEKDRRIVRSIQTAAGVRDVTGVY